MKKNVKLAFTILISLIFISNVNAATCDATEQNRLNSLAVNVKATYEETQGFLNKDEYTPPDGISEEELANYQKTYTYFKVFITNITEDLYVTVHNDVTNVSTTYKYANTDNGTVTIEWNDLYTIANLTITVYAANNTECSNTKLYTTYLTLPRLNEYSNTELCNNNENFYLCHKYLAIEDVDYPTFVERIEQYKKGSINSDGKEIIEEEKDKDKKNNKVAIIIAAVGAVVVVGGLTTVIIVKKKRSK